MQSRSTAPTRQSSQGAPQSRSSGTTHIITSQGKLSGFAAKLHGPAAVSNLVFGSLHDTGHAVRASGLTFSHDRVARRTLLLHDLKRLRPERRKHGSASLFFEQIGHDPACLRLPDQFHRIGTAETCDEGY